MNNVTWEKLVEANKTIGTMDIERKDNKTGKITVNEYAEVNQRVKAFRMVYPTGVIETEIISDEDGVIKMRATAGWYDDNGLYYKLATGTAFEVKTASNINRTSYIENCETSAIGRCLGFCGFGIDTAICSAEEVQNAVAQQEPVQAAPKLPIEEAFPEAPAVPGESWEDVEWRNKALQKYTLRKLDQACMNVWGTDFAHTPVAQVKTKMTI